LSLLNFTLISCLALLALHYFPTRRSSDLTIWVIYCSCSVIAYCHICACWELILVCIIDVVLNLLLFDITYVPRSRIGDVGAWLRGRNDTSSSCIALLAWH